MEQTTQPKNLFAEATRRKIEAQKSGTNQNSFGKFQQGKSRHAMGSPVGPSRGGRNKQGK